MVHKCQKCAYISNDDSDLQIHVQTIHKNLRINLVEEKKSIKIKCNKCEYECRYNKQLQKHTKDVHELDDDTRIYSCDSCPYTAKYVGQLWGHVHEKHPAKDNGFVPKNSNEAILNLLAEQNMALIEEVTDLKSGVKGSFKQLAEDFNKTLKVINDKAEEKDEENMKIIRKLFEKVEKLENDSKKSHTESSCAQSTPVPDYIPHKSTNAKTKPKTDYQLRKKVLYVADSVGRNVQFPKVENDIKCTVKTAKAYSAAYNKDAKWPDLNFTEVVNNEVTKQPYDVLVMTAPTVDITNLDTSKLHEEDNTDVYQQMVYVSCQNMFSAAQRAIQAQPNLEQVMLMEHPPRFDSRDLDPVGLKPKLAKLANSMYNQLWLDSPHKKRIIICSHNLDISSSGEKHDAMFKNVRTGDYDGVHHYGGRGRSLYSESVKKSLKNIVNNQNTKISQESPLPKNYHQKLCPQAMYQKSQKMAHTRYHSSVQDRNRFSVFNSNQGNLQREGSPPPNQKSINSLLYKHPLLPLCIIWKLNPVVYRQSRRWMATSLLQKVKVIVA